MKNSTDTLNKKLFIFFSIIIISSLHYLTATNIHILHDIYQRLYYIPIICAAIWFGMRGGLSVSAVISLIYVGHIVFQWKLMPHVSLQKYLEILIFNLVALTTGLLTEREQKLKNKYHKTADKLKELFERLKKQTKDMIEIEEQLRRADKLTMLGQISAELAHEIRNPLGSIKGTVEIIKGDYSPDDMKYEFIRILEKETKRLDDVLHKYLSFTKSGAFSASMVDVNQVIRETVSFLNLQIEKSGGTIKFDLMDTLPKIKLDSEQLKQVCLNILINGLQAIPETGGEITVTSRIERADDESGSTEYLCMDFKDTGAGIKEELIPDLFKPFSTTKEEGTGLGLSISQKIIEKFGGSIEVESELGKGSTFTIKLPYLKKDEDEEKDIDNR